MKKKAYKKEDRKTNRGTKGLIIVFTGDGKGKTSAALGIALRASGYGLKTLVIKFMKGPISSGEDEAVKKNPCIRIVRAGRGFYKILGDSLAPEAHKTAAEKGMRAAFEAVVSGRYSIVILDEINVAVFMKLIPFSKVKELIRAKPARLHLILTGRNASKALCRIADTVTEMKEVKHPFKKNIPAVRGIDY